MDNLFSTASMDEPMYLKRIFSSFPPYINCTRLQNSPTKQLQKKKQSCGYWHKNTEADGFCRPLLCPTIHPIQKMYLWGLSECLQLFLYLNSARNLTANYASISDTTPAPTVRPPSRIAKRRPGSIAIGVMSSTSIFTLSPGMHISVPSGSLITPVTSVVRK